jgi:flagellar basal-body rod modification protein FlgD
MTDAVSGIVPTSGTTQLPAGSKSSDSSTLAGNFQTFLTLLTTQLQNQNPLEPLDTNQFTQQLVQFASVEQQLKTNDQLTSLVSLQQTAQATQSLGFVGKTAVVPGNTASLTSSQAAWSLNIPANGKLHVTIANAQGQNVFTGDFTVSAGKNQPFLWDGKGTDGTQWQDGQYTMTATATDSAGNSQAIDTSIAGVVSSVDLTQTPPLLTIDGQSFTVNQIQRIVD